MKEGRPTRRGEKWGCMCMKYLILFLAYKGTCKLKIPLHCNRRRFLNVILNWRVEIHV